VIQQHAATALHFDFRIEVDGVLKSRAVPKGLSTDPREKRLAVQTEDHPLDYADFEGVIPEDDEGREVPIADALERGHADLWLEGRKLRGGWALVRAELGASRRIGCSSRERTKAPTRGRGCAASPFAGEGPPASCRGAARR
jgi:DNA ligase D-like protein (predicted 3'-phosphoesterase)